MDANNLLSTTLFLSFAVVGYSLYYVKQNLELLNTKKKDIDEDDATEPNVYQSWSGTFADGENSLVATIVRMKSTTRKKNNEWMEWDGSNDASVVTRNFYLGNLDPSFTWTIKQREFDTEAIAKETMVDGWNSVIQIKLTAYVKNPWTKKELDYFLKYLFQDERIEWQKTILTKREFEQMFN